VALAGNYAYISTRDIGLLILRYTDDEQYQYLPSIFNKLSN